MYVYANCVALGEGQGLAKTENEDPPYAAEALPFMIAERSG